MAQLTTHCYDKALKSKTGNKTIYLYNSWDMVHGRGWFCHVYSDDFAIGFGFNKNRFTAVKIAIKDLYDHRNHRTLH